MFTLSTLALFSTLALAVPVPRAKLDTATLLKNGRTAQNLNAQYQNTSASDACTCAWKICIAVNNALASCVDSKWQLKQCVDSLSCFAVPSLTASGVNVTCTSERNTLSAIKSTGASNVVALANEDDESCDPDTGDDDNDND
ncbi:hypothetical protein C8F01DRAFT_1323893 [Mycena amicta]|nr:hypothetical protein C8F01DRAFT_1323893 [Mycena amicta]